jgi:hypothetical protein
VSRWTTKFGPWRLVHTEEFIDYRAARKRELELKEQKGGQGFYKRLGLSFEELTQRDKQSGS